jgi:hypothetical protein
MIKVAAVVVLGVIVLGLVEYAILRRVAPIYVDGAGPMPSFYWGPAPTPTLREWRDNPEFQRLFLRPYKVVASLLALVGGVLVPISTRAFFKTSSMFRVSAAICFVVLLAISAVHDVIARAGVFEGMKIILSLGSLRVFNAAAIPAALLSGAIAVALRRALKSASTA